MVLVVVGGEALAGIAGVDDAVLVFTFVAAEVGAVADGAVGTGAGIPGIIGCCE